MSSLTVVMAQLNPLVGDIPGNTRKVIAAARRAEAEFDADIVVFTELVLTGYPPEDLLLRASLRPRIDQALAEIAAAELKPALVLGYPQAVAGRVFNMAGFFVDGQLQAEYAKQHLPNYQVFDEWRYFVPGDQPCVVDFRGIKLALTVCEDIWEVAPTRQAAEAGAQAMLNINASPFHRDKLSERQQLLRERAQEGGMPIVYVNQVGGQDELVFDGGSMVVDAQGVVRRQAPSFVEGLYPVTLEVADQGPLAVPEQEIAPLLSLEASVYQALVLGVRDYVNKNGFPGVVIGLSGGIDSALTLAVAVDALGAERVEAVMMPYHYTSDMSQEDAALEAERLGVTYHSISIEPMVTAFLDQLQDEFLGQGPRNHTEENIQARCRGIILMAISNKKGVMVLTTGNKSEMAVGYATLYGDMAGGFDVLKDVPKLLVYRLSAFRNQQGDGEIIPQRVIDRPPSAELAPDQQDSDSLPPYEILDPILELYVEKDYSLAGIVAEGFDEAVVRRVIRMVDINEYKRRQAPVGVRISTRAFGRDRRYPITSGWEMGV